MAAGIFSNSANRAIAMRSLTLHLGLDLDVSSIDVDDRLKFRLNIDEIGDVYLQSTIFLKLLL